MCNQPIRTKPLRRSAWHQEKKEAEKGRSLKAPEAPKVFKLIESSLSMDDQRLRTERPSLFRKRIRSCMQWAVCGLKSNCFISCTSSCLCVSLSALNWFLVGLLSGWLPHGEMHLFSGILFFRATNDVVIFWTRQTETYYLCEDPTEPLTTY